MKLVIGMSIMEGYSVSFVVKEGEERLLKDEISLGNAFMFCAGFQKIRPIPIEFSPEYERGAYFEMGKEAGRKRIT